nr:hypothetical protein [Hyalangium gracile]
MALYSFLEALGGDEEGGEVGQAEQVQVPWERGRVEDGALGETDVVTAAPGAWRDFARWEALGVEQAVRLDLELKELGPIAPAGAQSGGTAKQSSNTRGLEKLQDVAARQHVEPRPGEDERSKLSLDGPYQRSEHGSWLKRRFLRDKGTEHRTQTLELRKILLQPSLLEFVTLRVVRQVHAWVGDGRSVPDGIALGTMGSWHLPKVSGFKPPFPRRGLVVAEFVEAGHGLNTRLAAAADREACRNRAR